MTIPDKWVILKITNNETSESIYKVLASWYGGYLGSDSWRLNSGIVSINVSEEENYINFIGYSGSIYKCYNHCYGTSSYACNILNGIINRVKKFNYSIEIMPENTDWVKLFES